MNKNELRRLMLDQRKKLSQEQVNIASEAIVDAIKNLSLFKQSKIIMSYMPFGNEVNVLPLNQWILDQGMSLCIPRVVSGTEMDAVKIESLNHDLIKSRLGILEPNLMAEPVDVSKIELILVPGLAFDRDGNRLGHGKGYYDRFLAKCSTKTFLLGLAYSFQFFDKIPFDPYDIRIKGLVTENQQVLCQKQG